MAIKFNPLTGNFDFTGSGGGASYIDGEVATYADLPLNGSATLNSAWLVRTASGVWPVTRKQAGIYIRTATGGSNRDADYTYAGTMPDVFSDSQFLLYDNTDTSKNLAFDLGSISTGTTRTLTAPNTSGTMAMEHLIQEFAPDEGGYLPLVSAYLWDSAAQKQAFYVDNGVIKYVGTTNLLVSLSDANLSANRSYSFPNASGTIALQGAITSSGLTQATSRLLGRTTASTGAVEELTVGSGLTLASGSLAANFSAPPAIGSTTPAAISGTTGTFTTLTASTSLAITGGIITGASNVIEQVNSTSGQTFRLYNTQSGTGGVNFERLRFAWSSNVAIIGTEKGGTGTARTLEFQTDGVTRLSFTTGGNTQLTSGASLVFATIGRIIPAGTDGVIRISNIGDNGFDRLQFGGTTSSFPALKRSSATLQVRLADDSAYSVIDAQLRSQGTAPATTGATGTAGDIRYDADYIYVYTGTAWKRAALATW